MLTYSDSDGRDYLYVRLSREKAREIVTRHVIGNTPVRSYILEE
jgi:(2Fe-2S) ferredoxin